jgi:hypothetical protein|tara:strand:+ start:373 stop:1002 length:630 start_codon:yes stop_codon:yes gene_type:complete
MIKKNNYSFLKYLNYYDSINKYSLKSIHLVPQINKINLKISIEQNVAVKLKAQYKAFLFYYLHNFCCSKIVLNFFTSLKKKVKTMTLKSKVIIDISHKKIFDFLISLTFLLNNKLLKSSYTPALFVSNATSGKPQYEYLHLLFSSPLDIFSSKTNQSQQQISFNDLTVDFNFSLKNSVTLSPLNFFNKKKNNLHINIFKNIFMFWSLKF